MNMDTGRSSFVSLLKRAFQEKNVPTIGFLTIILCVYLLLLSVPFCPWIQNKVMEKFHLRSKSFASWSLWQIVPSMYSFSNDVWMSPALYMDGAPLVDMRNVQIYSINHYPLRYASFSLENRRRFASSKQGMHFFLLSRYHENKLSSIYYLASHNEGLILTRVPHE